MVMSYFVRSHAACGLTGAAHRLGLRFFFKLSSRCNDDVLSNMNL